MGSPKLNVTWSSPNTLIAKIYLYAPNSGCIGPVLQLTVIPANICVGGGNIWTNSNGSVTSTHYSNIMDCTGQTDMSERKLALGGLFIPADVRTNLLMMHNSSTPPAFGPPSGIGTGTASAATACTPTFFLFSCVICALFLAREI